MICPSCGEDSGGDGARFCEGCGAPFDAAKPAPKKGCRCAAPDLDADGFCQICGLKPAKPQAAAEHEQALDVALALASDKGRRHPTNQDFGLVARRADGAALLVVADGVSASDNPEAASRAAVKAAETLFLSGSAAAEPLSTEAAALVRAAAEAVIATPVAERLHDGPASTIVLAVVRPHASAGLVNIGLAWVGDSRAYLVTPNVPATVLTSDDSWMARQLEAGKLSREEVMRSPFAHAITQWLGMEPAEMTIHTHNAVATPGAVLLLCSDGLWMYADDPASLARAYTEAARGAADAAATCRALISSANAAGGADNITVALARL